MNLAATSPSALAPGAVAWIRQSKWVVLERLTDGRALMARIGPCAEPLCRGDVVLDHDDLPEMGVPQVASYAAPWVVYGSTPTEVAGGIRIGTCPPRVWQQICAALRRAGETQRIEGGYGPTKRPARR